MCQANPPPGGNPASRGAGNGIGSTNYADGPAAQTPYTPPTSETTSSGTQVPLGANASLAASRAREGDQFGTQSFQQQGFAGVATRPDPNTVANTASNALGIVGPRMMDTGPLFGSAVGSTPSPTNTIPTINAPRMMDTNGLFGSAPLNPTPTVAPFPETPKAEQAQQADPFILRDQMYGLAPTSPQDNVANALMRRRRRYY